MKNVNGVRSVVSVLEKAAASKRMVRVRRDRLEPGVFAAGYVLDVSSDLMLMHKLSDRLDLDGYEVLRLRDISLVEDDSSRLRFYERALTAKQESPQPPSGVEIANMPRAVVTIASVAPLLVVAREALTPDEVTIGRVMGVLKSGFRLQPITPEAKIVASPTLYRFSSITRLEFGGEYERTLALVAGIPPVSDQSATHLATAGDS